MKIKISLLIIVFLVSTGLVRSDPVTMSNLNIGGNTVAGSVYIQFSTFGSGSFNLTSLQFGTGNIIDSMTFQLLNSSAQIVNGISGTRDITANGALDISGFNDFGAGTYWLFLSGFSNGYDKGNSATLTSSNNSLVSNGTLVDNVNGSSVGGDLLFQATLTVAVPEPSTMFLCSSSLLFGAVYTLLRRKKVEKSN